VDGLLADFDTGPAAHAGAPVALFGHSMGAVVAWELANRLSDRGGPVPVRLFLSGCRPPQLPPLRHPWHAMPEDALVEQLRRLDATSPEILGNAELLRHFLPAIRADLTIAETYGQRRTHPLNCPITVFTGRDDPNVSSQEAAAWGELAGSSFELEVVPGGHLFLTQDPAGLVRRVADRLKTNRRTESSGATNGDRHDST
jgi:surfactin synthase thioesterase subunit